jgi:hypothetical protein
VISEDQVAAGREAWARIREHGRRSWDDWLAVARGVAVCRDAALQEADRSTQYGKRYTAAMAAQLAAGGLDGVNQQVRYRLFQVLENLPAIERFCAGMDKIGHPDSIWPLAAFDPHARRNPGSKEAHPLDTVAAGPHPRRTSLGVHPASHVAEPPKPSARPAHDCIVIARKCLEAALRDQQDLLDLTRDPVAAAPRIEKPATALFPPSFPPEMPKVAHCATP